MKKQSHPYIPNSLPETKKEMMREIGIETIEELYKDVAEKYLLEKPLNLPHASSEFEVKKQVETLLSKNSASNGTSLFLGAGCWPHYVPAVLKEIVQRNELLTSYTPYQPEISQGLLQALFEYQSMICELTDMEVANCSMYDWASALGEAARMATRLTDRREIMVPKIIHPERLATLRTYVNPAGIDIHPIDFNKDTGQISLQDLRNEISDETAAVYLENPSYLGVIETQMDDASHEAHKHGALFIVGVDPSSLGVLRPPGSYGADIVVGEAQPLGNHMNFGGPLLGIFACRDDLQLIRQMPGRIVGMTTTKDDSRQGFCMTLQTREQHIKRERATSNICTNEASCAISSAVYMALMGPRGLQELGKTIMYRANYAIYLLSEIDGVETPVFKSPHFKEFTVNFDGCGLNVEEVNKRLLKLGVHGGKDISREYPEFGQTALYCVTEIHSEKDIERLSSTLEKVLE